MANRTKRLLFLLALPVSAAWADDTADLRAERTLRRTLEPPTVAYEGVLTVTHWFGDQARTEDVHVRFSPPASYRWEFLKPDGTVCRVVTSDGKHETVRFTKNSNIIKTNTFNYNRKRLPSHDEWALLRENYRIAATSNPPVAGRDTWLVRIDPRANGKLRQEMAVDRQTGVVLETKRYRPNGQHVVHSRFHRFHVAPSFPEGMFVVVMGSVNETAKRPPHFLRHNKDTADVTPVHPDRLPHGFVLEGTDTLMIHGTPVDHLRYTDGLSSISVFQVQKPSKPQNLPTTVEEGNVITHNGRHGNYMLVGDTPVEMLNDMARLFP